MTALVASDAAPGGVPLPVAAKISTGWAWASEP
jgi:hypothetical protein